MDALETQLLLNRSKVKSPGFAGVLGFFLPWAAALYNGKIGAMIGLFMIDAVFWVLSIFGIGFFMLFIFGIISAYLNYKWAEEANTRALERAVLAARAASGAV